LIMVNFRVKDLRAMLACGSQSPPPERSGGRAVKELSRTGARCRCCDPLGVVAAARGQHVRRVAVEVAAADDPEG
jgi:hypothetical protein